MQVMTYDEMRRIDGGREASCARSAIAWGLSEAALIGALIAGGPVGLAAVGMGVALWGMMYACG